MYEEFDTLEEAETRARELYTDVTPSVVLGSWWMHHGYITEVDDKFRLDTSR